MKKRPETQLSEYEHRVYYLKAKESEVRPDLHNKKKKNLKMSMMTVADPEIRFACVAITPGTEEGKVHRGISICSAKDNFNRKLARKIAVGRLMNAIRDTKINHAILNDKHEGVQKLRELFEAAGAEPELYKADLDVPGTEKELYLIRKMREAAEAAHAAPAAPVS